MNIKTFKQNVAKYQKQIAKKRKGYEQIKAKTNITLERIRNLLLEAV